MSNREYYPWLEPVGSAPHYLPPAPESGLEPMPVDDNVITIANLMKPDAEKKLGTTFTTYTPDSYILKGGINFCIRVKVQDHGLIDVKGSYAAGSVRNVKARRVTEDVQMEFF